MIEDIIPYYYIDKTESVKYCKYADTNGLYPIDILVLYRINTNDLYSIQKEYARYSLEKCQDNIDGLISKGIIELEKYNRDEMIRKLEIKEMEVILKENNQPFTGTKKTLIEKIKNDIGDETLSTYYTPTCYVRTEKGKKAIKDNEYVMFMDYCGPKIPFSMYDMNTLINEYPDLNYQDIIRNWTKYWVKKCKNNRTYEPSISESIIPPLERTAKKRNLILKMEPKINKLIENFNNMSDYCVR